MGLPAARFPAYWNGRHDAARTLAVVRQSTLVIASRRHDVGVTPPDSGRLRSGSATANQEFSRSPHW